MARFVRHDAGAESAGDRFPDDGEHPDLVHRVQAYCQPMVPDRKSSMSLREQHLSGFLFNRRKGQIPSERPGRH